MKGGDLNPQDLKHFIKESYNKDDNRNENVGDFVYDKDLSNNKASVYYNPKTGQATITHRGTNGTMTDWGHNLKYSLGLYGNTKRAKKGKQTQAEVEKKYGKQNLSTIGHSQGSINAREYGKNSKEIINLNEAYVPSLSYRKPKKNEYSIRSSSDVVSLPKMKDDLITSLLNKKQSKQNMTIKSKNSFDVLGNHSPDVLDGLNPNEKIGRK
jgi:hypothetical protein